MKRLSLIALGLMALGGCSSPESTPPAPAVLRLGYFPNITHAQALIGTSRGDFQQKLGGVKLETRVFNAGPSLIEALFAGEVDVGYIGPNPAITGFIQSKGEALRIVAGATSGGASLVVRANSGIRAAGDLAGRTVASPQLGNTQDVALRNYVLKNGMQTRENGGTVTVMPMANAQILDAFRAGQVDAAWVPEPWASRLVIEAGGIRLLDERTLWPGGDFVTAHIIASPAYLRRHHEAVKGLLEAHLAITEWSNANPAEAQRLVNAEIQRLTGKKLDDRVMGEAWNRLRLTWDPIASSLFESARSARAAGLLRDDHLAGIYDLTPINEVLTARGAPVLPQPKAE